jgi:Ankyrin repeats (many copies)
MSSGPRIPLPAPTSPFSPINALHPPKGAAPPDSSAGICGGIPSCQILDEFDELLSALSDAGYCAMSLKDLKDTRGRNPIALVCSTGNIALLRVLVAKRLPAADFLAVEPKQGLTVLMIAATSRCPHAHRCAELLIRSFPELLPMKDREGRTCLHWAVIGGELTNISTIVRHCDLQLLNAATSPTAGKETALMLASYLGNARVVESLLLLGADVTARSAAGLTALDYAYSGIEDEGRGADDEAFAPIVPLSVERSSIDSMSKGTQSDYRRSIAALESSGATRSGLARMARSQSFPASGVGSAAAAPDAVGVGVGDRESATSSGSIVFSFLGRMLKVGSRAKITSAIDRTLE